MSELVPQEDSARVEEVSRGAEGKVYLAPCQIACPLGEDIQRSHAMLALLPLDPEEAARQIIKIGDEIYEKNPLFPVCSYICGLCERQCNYRDETGAVRRRMLVRLVADRYLKYLDTAPTLPTPDKEKVAVIGSGPGGLMCAYELSKRGYRVTILERSRELGGALRLIPRYRIPRGVIDSVISSLLRIAHIEVRLGAEIGGVGKRLDDIKKEGYQAIFLATGTPVGRLLTIDGKPVDNVDLEGVTFGLNLLYEVNQGIASPRFYRSKKVIVVGGGNVAFDVARTARRLGGEVTLVCLENEDRSSRNGIPADEDEVEGATQEGIRVVYSRGVVEIIGESGKFRKIKCPRCTSVFDEDGGFNPRFDHDDVVYLDGDVLLVTIGQEQDRTVYEQEGLLGEGGKLEVDEITLMSNLKEGVFIGGDVRRIGFAAEAMWDGLNAAESIDRYIRGENLTAGRKKEYQDAPVLSNAYYKPQPPLVWVPAEERLNFEPFEEAFTLEQVVEEARRCLCCGPCKSCKGCVAAGLQPVLPGITYDEELCINCGDCAYYCPCDAISFRSPHGVSFDMTLCRGCGLCAAVCPAMAIELENWERARISGAITEAVSEMKRPGILVFLCQWTVLPHLDKKINPNVGIIDVPCAARVEGIHILEALQQGFGGILIIACPEEDCHRQTGSREAQRSIEALDNRLSQIGLQDRVGFCTVTPRHQEEFDRELERFNRKIESIGSKESR
ncbi:MAG: FAD-dependent oxidoreductase [Dehalococcoidales bacterium]|nr:FAD-dependent oxidoreductase [Dehalococcoidales bacterium]